MQKTRFVVTRPGERDPDYLFKDPESGKIVPGGELDNPFCHQPEPFEEAQAKALAEALNLAGASPRWEVCVAPSPCPGCGREMWANDFDFCYPGNRERSKWRAGCNVHDFGCGFEAPVDDESHAGLCLQKLVHRGAFPHVVSCSGGLDRL